MALIYFIEDDETIAYVIEKTLINAKYDFRYFKVGKDLLNAINDKQPDLILMDLMLKNESGLDYVKVIKNTPKTQEIPIIIISALASEMDKVTGLDLGADDYLTKPFGVLELLSRINNQLRKKKEQSTAQIGNVTINLTKREASINESIINLTYKEFELLHTFLTHPDEVLSRDTLFNIVWGSDLVLETRTIDMHIKSLRKKLMDAHASIEIYTVRSVGYRVITL